MEQKNFIEAKNEPVAERSEDFTREQEEEYDESVAFVETNRDFFEHYAKGRFKVAPAPKGINTFAFDLETDTIYVNPMFYKKRGLSEQKTLFAIMHEIQHFAEKKAMLLEDGGDKKFEKYIKRIKDSKAFGLIDNCVADVRENRAVVSWEPNGLGQVETKIYKEDLFPETDFTKKPRHIQFCEVLLREARVPDEKCVVSPEVRTALDEVAKVKELMSVMTNPETPMSMRLKLQDKFILPKVEALMEKDMEEKKEKSKEKKENGDKGEGEPKEGGEGEGEPKEGGEEEGNEKPKDGEKGKQGKDKNPGDGKGDGNKKKPGGGDGDGKEGEEDETDPNKIFADDYAEANKNFPEAVPLEEIEKAFNAWKEAKDGKDAKETADEAYAQKIGVGKEDLQNYRKIVQSLESVVNPETSISVLEELRNLFLRIISKRLKTAQAPRYPVEDGDELVDPAGLVAEVRSGNLQPKVWEDIEIKEKKGDKFGEVEITLVCDRSSSMNDGGGEKAKEQRKSAVLVMEVLKEFAELCDAERINVDKPLEVKSEIYSFSRSAQDKIPLKKMSPELGEAERINVLKKLYDLPGSTTDFVCLEAIDAKMDDETKKKIKTGELKKIVIVFTDGESDSPAKVQGVLKSLREGGVVAIGVGLTKAGKAVLSTYAPNAQVVEEIQKLGITLGELLKEHLKDV